MAIYRLSVSIISRASGGSALAAAAYRSASELADLGGKLFDALAAAAYRSGSALGLEGQGTTHDYGRKSDVRHAEILLPEGAAPWLADREALWNAVEASEKRKDSQLAREIQVTLPRELPEADRLQLVRGFVRDQLTARGMVVDLAIHDGRARDGGRHPHAHLLLTMRHLDPTSRTGFGQKAPQWNRKELLQTWRESWAEHVNAALERGGIAELVDHRTLDAQRREALAAGDWDKAAAFDREPEPKLGKAAAALERKGQRTERGDVLREVHARNALRRQAYALVAEFGTQARATFLELRERSGDALTAFSAWSRERASELLDAGRDLLARLRNAILPERTAGGAGTAGSGPGGGPALAPAPETALDRMRRQLGPQPGEGAPLAEHGAETSLARLQRSVEQAEQVSATAPQLPAATRAALDRVKARMLAERQQAKQQEPGTGGQGRDTPELPPRTREAIDRLKARMLAGEQQSPAAPDPTAQRRADTPELPPQTRAALDRLKARMLAERQQARSSPASEAPGRTRERTRDRERGR